MTGRADLGNPLDRLWSGALEVLRAATYFEMKQRAGAVGAAGLGPLVGRLHATQPDLRVHLLGHSFGARLVSYALSGLPQDGGPSPVKTVFLLQGAFSHFAFAASLPQDPARSGGLAQVFGGAAPTVQGVLVHGRHAYHTAQQADGHAVATNIADPVECGRHTAQREMAALEQVADERAKRGIVSLILQAGLRPRFPLPGAPGRIEDGLSESAFQGTSVAHESRAIVPFFIG